MEENEKSQENELEDKTMDGIDDNKMNEEEDDSYYTMGDGSRGSRRRFILGHNTGGTRTRFFITALIS